MDPVLFPDREVRHRVNGLLSKFPYKKMREWTAGQKNLAVLREMKNEMFDFYFLMEDISPEAITKRQQRWSELQKKYPQEIISILLLLGGRGRQLYQQATAGDRYAVMVFLLITDAVLREA